MIDVFLSNENRRKDYLEPQAGQCKLYMQFGSKADEQKCLGCSLAHFLFGHAQSPLRILVFGEIGFRSQGI